MTDKNKYFCSWSGGKDSALALYQSIESGKKPSFLLTMMIETGQRSRSHGIPKNILETQAHSLGIPILFSNTSWNTYTDYFLQELKKLKQMGVDEGIFGDIDIEMHYEWVQNVCTKNDLRAFLPLWHMQREIILKKLFENGFQAEIISVKDGVLPPNFLGKTLNHSLIEEFKALGIDLCGENGEYHTFVTNGPIFQYPLHIQHGDKVLRDGYWFSDISLT